MISRKNGFILVELLLVLMISGVLVTSGIGLLNIYLNNEKTKIDKYLKSEIRKSIIAFYDVNGYLPCPSSLNMLESDSNFGQSQDCKIMSNEIVQGGVPFKALGLSSLYESNPWQRKFFYVIPKNLGISEDEFLRTNDLESLNSIDLKKLDGTSININIAFLIIDFFHSKNGIYKKNSTKQKKCLNNENCNNNNVLRSEKR